LELIYCMTRVDLKPGQDISAAIRAFKKKCAKDGVLKDFKRSRRFEKPSERRRKEFRESVKRCRIAALKAERK